MIAFVVPGVPVAKGRARSRIARSSSGKTFVSHYTPAETRSYENLVRMCAKDAMGGGVPLDLALSVEIVARIPVPASWSNKRRERALAGLVGATKRPDGDNYAKAVLDGCNAVVWKDDAQLVDIVVRKRYASIPQVEVTVVPLDVDPA